MRDLISYPVHAAHRAHRSMNFSFLSPVLPFGLEANNTLKGSFVFQKWAILQLCT